MIYPDFRLSDLESDAAQKKETFHSSKNTFINSAKEKLHPVALLKENKKIVFAGLLSLVAFGKMFAKLNKTLGPKVKNSKILSILKTAWFWKLIGLSFNIYKLAGPSTKRSSRD